MILTTKLWKHQEEMVAFIEDKFVNGMGYQPVTEHPDTTYTWLIAGCRTGKTLASIAVIDRMDFKRTLVITKKPAITSAWRKDIQQRTSNLDYVLLYDDIETPTQRVKRATSSKKAKFLTEYVDDQQIIVVVNYETAKLIVDTLAHLNFDYVILDESHLVKSHNSQVSVMLAKKLYDIPHKLIMTGTAWDDRPTDVYGQVRFLANTGRGRYPSSVHFGTWGEFFERHVNYSMMNNIKIPRSYKNVEQIADTINPFTMRIDTEDVLDLPPVRHITIDLDMPKAMKTAYKDLEDLMIAEIGDDLLVASNRLVQSLRLHQLTGGYFINEEGELVEYLADKDNPKIQALLDIVDEVGGQPLVVFTRFKHDVTLIERNLQKAGIETRKLVGGTYEHVEWQEGDGQVLIANIQAGGTGVTLSRARYAVYYSVGNSRTDYTQSLWRIRDNSSDKTIPIVYHHLVVNNSVDVEIRNGLDAKGDMSNFLLQNLVNRLTSK